jgi:hypothetical protein
MKSLAVFLAMVCSCSGAMAQGLDGSLATSSAGIQTSSNESVKWGPLFKEASFFLLVEHSYRAAFDTDTRNYLGGRFFQGYLDSVTNFHGWGDGDPLVVNYIGHPIQGAVAGDIWTHNDPRFRQAVFGRDGHYWKGKLRAAAFTLVYSEQFELGPVSEASIGHIQSRYPQQGIVDQVITPSVGLGWMVAEDAIDRFVIRRIEHGTSKRWVRIAARGFLNPARTFANCMEFELPWNRETR